MATAAPPRQPFSPKPLCLPDCESSSLYGEEGNENWVPLIACPADFPPELFDTAISQLIYHPEYNSTLILRSDTVTVFESDFPKEVPALRGLRPLRSIHRKLLPRRPGRDAGLEQYCTLFFPVENHAQDDSTDPTVLVLTPIVGADGSLPYYHPKVSHLAFRYILSETPTLQIEVIPLPGTPTDLDSRLYRTCLSLLDTLHRYGWGAMIQYKKRVIHDRIVPRDEYQDLYLVMRERHKHLVDTWQEVTDPLKHVFEDIGIATFLMLLWKHMYATEYSSQDDQSLENEPWRTWPCPSAGFVDLGCGNGLLVHILVAEGYEGHGIDVRARTSWSHYSDSTQKHLHVEALDPTALAQPDFRHPYLLPNAFLIGNHADELTPWVPVLSTLISASGYISIPCCAWTFDSRFERSKGSHFPLPTSPEEYAETLYLGGDGSHTSSYSQYRIWLASLSLHCGWEVECETLRIPSTRNWALIGRKRTGEDAGGALQNVLEIVERVRERGIFKTRRPEGKAGDH